jgi:hypothetical protein
MDFGEMNVWIDDVRVRVHLLVATLFPPDLRSLRAARYCQSRT